VKHDFIPILRCPETRQQLHLQDPKYDGNEIMSGWLVCEDGSRSYPIRSGIPRFVSESNYADNFGMQWNTFRRTQLDSFSGHSISADRFWKATGWNPEALRGAWVLDAGCGAGRFAEVALNAGARMVALDYSSAVDACHANLKHHPNLNVVQGDIYSLPFTEGCFSFVYSLGVLQHTPNVAKAFHALPPMLERGGGICVDFYEKSLKSMLLPKYWLRPFTKGMPKEHLFTLLSTLVPSLLSLSRFSGRTPVFGSLLKRIVPVANYDGILPLSNEQHREWSLLDTFDWFSPAYDQPQRATTIKKWLLEAGLQEAEVLKAGHLVGRAWKP
jgi:2-polyprenyl-3-methyl-5-hydroxy-6-metoxy-1,4-benzoquinol methylase